MALDERGLERGLVDGPRHPGVRRAAGVRERDRRERTRPCRRGKGGPRPGAPRGACAWRAPSRGCCAISAGQPPGRRPPRKRQRVGHAEVRRRVVGAAPVELEPEARAVGARRVRAVADDERSHLRLLVATHPQHGGALRGAHPLVEVPGVVRGPERAEVERDHAGAVGAVHQRVDAALAELGDEALEGQHDPRGARHVVEEREPRRRAHVRPAPRRPPRPRPSRGTGPAPARRGRRSDPPRCRARCRTRCTRGPSSAARRRAGARASRRTVFTPVVALGTNAMSSGSAPTNAPISARAASSPGSSSRTMKRTGSASSRARQRSCASSTGRGHAPKEPWLRNVTAGSRVQCDRNAFAGAGIGEA